MTFVTTVGTKATRLWSWQAGNPIFDLTINMSLLMGSLSKLAREIDARNHLRISRVQVDDGQFFDALDAWEDYCQFEKQVGDGVHPPSIPLLAAWEHARR